MEERIGGHGLKLFHCRLIKHYFQQSRCTPLSNTDTSRHLLRCKGRGDWYAHLKNNIRASPDDVNFVRSLCLLFYLSCGSNLALERHRLQSFEIPDIPVRWYTFKKRPLQSPSALDLELPEESGGDPSADAAEEGGGGDKEDGDEESNEEIKEEILPQPPALKAVYARGGGENFLLAMGGWARGAIFECSWEVGAKNHEPQSARAHSCAVFKPSVSNTGS